MVNEGVEPFEILQTATGEWHEASWPNWRMLAAPGNRLDIYSLAELNLLPAVLSVAAIRTLPGKILGN